VSVDAFLAIASRREGRDYAGDPVAEESLRRILEGVLVRRRD